MRTRNLKLKTAACAKENALPPRKDDLFSILQDKNEASIFEETWLLHLAQIDNTITAGANKDCVVQPALTFHERAANEKLVLGEMDVRGILERLENGNVLDSREATFAIVVQQNESATIQYVRRALRSRGCRPLPLCLDCY